MDRGKRLIGILIIIVSITSLIAWEKWGKDRLMCEEVLTLNQNLAAGTLIEESMLEVSLMQFDEGGYLKPGDETLLVGKECNGFVHKGVPLYREYFCDAVCDPSKSDGRVMVTIWDAWLTGMPKGLERGDTALFYHRGKEVCNARVSQTAEDGKSFCVIMSGSDAARFTALLSEKDKLSVSFY